MKNSFLRISILVFVIFNLDLVAQEIEIKSSKMQYDDLNKITIFEGSVNSIDEKVINFFLNMQNIIN